MPILLLFAVIQHLVLVTFSSNVPTDSVPSMDGPLQSCIKNFLDLLAAELTGLLLNQCFVTMSITWLGVIEVCT